MTNIFTRTILSLLLLIGMSLQSSAQNPTSKVYKREGEKYYFGKMYIPQGTGKFKLKHTPSQDAVVELYYGHINGNKIYMMPMVITEDCYYVDATNCSHAFVVRTNIPDDVVMETATAEDDEIIKANDSFYFNKALSFQNKLRFTTTMVPNETLRENATYKNKNIYFMANPVRYGLAFAWLDQFGTTRKLAANSLYILGTKMALSSEMIEVIWPDDIYENMTAINTVKKQATIDNAVYTLTGQKVGTAADFESLPKGLYIVNGRKVMKR